MQYISWKRGLRSEKAIWFIKFIVTITIELQLFMLVHKYDSWVHTCAECVDLHSYDLIHLHYDYSYIYEVLYNFVIDVCSQFIEYVLQGYTVIYLLLGLYLGLLASTPQGIC